MFNDSVRKTYSPDSLLNMNASQLNAERTASPYLKVHMKDGSLYVLKNWEADPSREYISGYGKLYDSYRDSIGSGHFTLRADSAVIFETNSIKPSGTAAAFTIYSGITAAITIYCMTNPKACFGSCPTFYTNDGDSLRLQAEGFSSSIAPSMEATDIDALYHSRPECDEYTVEMRNEALETHVVRSVNLLAVEKSRKENKIFYSPDGAFWECSSIIPPVSAAGPEGNCLGKLLKADGLERFSAADSFNLGAKEYIYLDFNNSESGKYGIVIGCRQTLLSTYLIYQTFAYMGNDVSRWIAELERNKINVKGNEILNLLGGLEAEVLDSEGCWRNAGSIDEYGPLAADFHILPVNGILDRNARVRLKLTKGYWRIDYAALAPIKEAARPERIQPFEVIRDGKTDPAAREILCDSSKTLVTLPGDTYRLNFRLPSLVKDYELFLETRGYYLEWIRNEWIREENPRKLAEIFLNPEAALKRMAPEFKAVESQMENSFWRSKYAKP